MVKDLKEYGFQINPYDPCVANMEVNGKQLTVLWHVDDVKISHVESEVVGKFIDWMRSQYEGTHGKMEVARGRKHLFLGMQLDYQIPGVVKISMNQFVVLY